MDGGTATALPHSALKPRRANAHRSAGCSKTRGEESRNPCVRKLVRARAHSHSL